MRRVSMYFLLFLATSILAQQGWSAERRLTYPIVGTGQTKFYDSRSEITPPEPGKPFYGQDSQGKSRKPSYKLSDDGLTVYDKVSGLTWQRSPDTNRDGVLDRSDKLTLAKAKELPAKLNAEKFGGFSDWRLPSIKELYSLIVFSGLDPSGPAADESRMKPFIDTRYFTFAYGDTRKGERLIDSQYASSTKYVGKSFRNFDKLFGVNFADGRIKGYDLLMPGGGQEKTFFVICCRGNPAYGKNDFHDNGDGTITDRATGLTWSRDDSGKGMNWEAALAWVQAKNAEKYLGHGDWRLPSAKEMQSIVDYSRAPDVTNCAAIDPRFHCSQIKNEVGKADYPFYWTGTTHASMVAGRYAVYVAFGRAAGWPSGMPGGGAGRGGPGMGPGPQRPAWDDPPTPRQGGGPFRPGFGGPPPQGPGFGGPPAAGRQNQAGGTYRYVDVHGAGAQRSDPKTGDPAGFPHGHGPQGDVIRINNYVRLVRDE